MSGKVISAGEKVRVAVRVRPVLDRDQDVGAVECLDGNTVATPSVSAEQFHFDYVFGPTTNQSTVLSNAVLPVMNSWVEGYNGCVLAYGQTGSGKTFTMLGEEGGRSRTKRNGVIPMVAETVFQRLHREQQQFTALTCSSAMASEFQVRCSYVEVYKDDVFELLGTGPKSLLSIREHKGRVIVPDAEERRVCSTQEVLAAIDEGAQRRVTGQNNVHEYSSRSHAVFTLILEHRWKGEDGGMKMKQSRMTFVDLAGSEQPPTSNETRFAESVAINTGLLVLGNVIAALSGDTSRRVGDHVPYRDSSLTRLLQPSLGGDSKTVLIACVAPGSRSAAESIATMSYARRARLISNKPQCTIVDVPEEADPMSSDVEDPDRGWGRRCAWIDTVDHGEVFARVVGNPADPLILFVHGSGPTNSSTWWNSLVHQLHALTERATQRFYMVAIDCPGYGRSLGDRQIIRSYPGAFLGGVVAALGKSKAFCLVGSSQGACAIFNAALEVPGICDFLTVMDPVGHDVSRYSRIKQPSLLTFDIEDEGHPVKVGRLMKQYLPTNTYFEFSSKTEPCWHVDHMAQEMLRLFADNSKLVMKHGHLQKLHTAVHDALTRLAGGLFSWSEHGGFGEPIKEFGNGLLFPLSRDFSAFSDSTRRQLSIHSSDESSYRRAETELLTEPLVFDAVVDPDTGRVVYIHPRTGERLGSLPPGAQVSSSGANQRRGSTTERRGLFDEGSDSDETETEEQRVTRLEQERAEKHCQLCKDILWGPMRLPCRHVLCELCFGRSVRYNRICPFCEAPVPKPKDVDVDADHQCEVESALPVEDRVQLIQRISAITAQRSRYTRIVLEYGNTADPVGNTQFTMKAFMRVRAVEKGKIDGKSAIGQVHFNINPDFPKAAIKVRQPPFTLERTMGIEFTCEMTVYWSQRLEGWPPVVVPFYMHHVPRYERAVVVLVDEEAIKQRKPKNTKVKPVVFEGGPIPELLICE